MIDRTNAVNAKNETKLLWLIEPGMISDETRSDNDMIDHIGVIYIETEIELSRPIWSGVICNENYIR